MIYTEIVSEAHRDRQNLIIAPGVSVPIMAAKWENGSI
jgi:hypothetical protein